VISHRKCLHGKEPENKKKNTKKKEEEEEEEEVQTLCNETEPPKYPLFYYKGAYYTTGSLYK